VREVSGKHIETKNQAAQQDSTPAVTAPPGSAPDCSAKARDKQRKARNEAQQAWTNALLAEPDGIELVSAGIPQGAQDRATEAQLAAPEGGLKAIRAWQAECARAAA
jgi:hypothetical protein